MNRIVVMSLVSCLLPAVWSETNRAEIVWQRVISDDGGRYIGWPTVARLKNGDLIVSYSGDRDNHVCPWGKVRLVRSGDGGESWSKPVTVMNGVLDDRDSGIIELSNGNLVLFWFTSIAYHEYANVRNAHPEYERHHAKIPSETIRPALGAFSAVSKDGGKTWSKPVRMPASAPHGGIELKDGRLLVVGRQWSVIRGHLKEDPEERCFPPHPTLAAVESFDGGESWHELAQLPLGTTFDKTALCEPHVIECEDGTLVCFVRYHVGNQRMLRTESKDGGKTWSELAETDVDGYPGHLAHLADGRILLSYARRKSGRIGEFARIGDGWCKFAADDEIELARDGNPDLGYPSSAQLANGDILTVYYQHPKPNAPAALMATKWRLKNEGDPCTR